MFPVYHYDASLGRYNTGNEAEQGALATAARTLDENPRFAINLQIFNLENGGFPVTPGKA
jgi:hypothetical protein